MKKEEIAASASNPGAGRQAAPAPVRNEKESVRTEATVENKTIQEKTEVKAPVVKRRVAERSEKHCARDSRKRIPPEHSTYSAGTESVG